MVYYRRQITLFLLSGRGMSRNVTENPRRWIKNWLKKRCFDRQKRKTSQKRFGRKKCSVKGVRRTGGGEGEIIFNSLKNNLIMWTVVRIQIHMDPLWVCSPGSGTGSGKGSPLAMKLTKPDK
jgi:hypothetical protein